MEPVTPADAAELTAVFFKSFSDDFSQRMFPRTPDVHAWYLKVFTTWAEEGQSGSPNFQKVVARGEKEPGVIAGFAKWVLPGVEEGHDQAIAWPEGADSELCDTFFGEIEEERKRVTGDRPHYFLDMLAVNPDFNRRGLGSRLLKWGLDQADGDGVPLFLSASPQGRPLYERNGFEVVRDYEVVPGYVQTTMLRPATKV